MTCSGDIGECPEPVEQSGLCAGHRQRQKRGEPTNTPLRDYGDKWGTLTEAWRRLLNDTDGFDREAYERAKENVRIAMKRWMSERYRLVPKDAANNVPKPTDS
jgi:hypothetical protein